MQAIIGKASLAIANNPVLPILDSVKFEAVGNTVTVTAADMEIFIVQTIKDVEVLQPGSICIPAKQLLDTLKTLPETSLEILADPSGKVTIKSQNGKYSMPGEPANDFPRCQEMPAEGGYFLSPNQLVGMFDCVTFACSGDELRPAMTGVSFETSPGGFTATATDAHRLSSVFLKADGGGPGTVVFPKRFVSLASKVLHGEEIRVSVTKENVFVEGDGYHIGGRLIDARYPDWRAVVPQKGETSATINRANFISALNRIIIFANRTTNQVLCTFQKDSVTLSSADTSSNLESDENVDVSLNGEPMTIAFNGKMLAEGLAKLVGENVTLELSGPSRAGILRGEREGHFVMVMPVMLT